MLNFLNILWKLYGDCLVLLPSKLDGKLGLLFIALPLKG